MATFYRGLLGGADLRTAIAQMNARSGGSDTYRMTPAELLLFAAFDRYLDLADDANINSRVSEIVAGAVTSRGLDFL